MAILTESRTDQSHRGDHRDLRQQLRGLLRRMMHLSGGKPAQLGYVVRNNDWPAEPSLVSVSEVQAAMRGLDSLPPTTKDR